MERLDGLRILLVEDEVLVALNMETELADVGAAIVGPAFSLDDGLGLLDERIDAAVLDINLGDRQVWPLARALEDRSIPFLFASANCADQVVRDNGYGDVRCIDKPIDFRELIAKLAAMVTVS